MFSELLYASTRAIRSRTAAGIGHETVSLTYQPWFGARALKANNPRNPFAVFGSATRKAFLLNWFPYELFHATSCQRHDTTPSLSRLSKALSVDNAPRR